MHKSRLLLVTALVLITTISAYGALPPDKALDKPVTLAVKGEALCDIMLMLQEQTGVRLQVGRDIADHKATIFVDAKPLRKVMEGLSTLFGYHWSKKTFSTGDVYEFWQDEKSRREREDKFRKAWSESWKLAFDDVKAMLEVARMTPEQKRAYEAKVKAESSAASDETRAKNVALYEAVSNPAYALCAGAFLGLPSTVHELLAPGVVVRYHTASQEDEWRLPDDFARDVLAMVQSKTGGANPNEPEPRDISLDITLGKSEKSVDLQAKVNCDIELRPGVSIGRSYMIRLAERTLADVMPEGTPLPRSDKNSPAEMQVEWTRKDLETAGARTWGPTGSGTLWVNRSDMLWLLHERLGLQVISDHCSHWDVRSPAGKQTIGEILRSYDKTPEFAGMHLSQAVWGWDGDFLYMRAKDPVHARASEVPNRQLRRWASVYKEHGYLGLDDHAEISLLSEQQQVGLMTSRTFLNLPGEGNLGPDTLRLYGMLTPTQRTKASGDGLEVSELTELQVRELVRLAPGSVKSGQISLGHIPSCVGVWKDGLRLDRRQPADPRTLPAMIRMTRKTQPSATSAGVSTSATVTGSISGGWVSDGGDPGSPSGTTQVIQPWSQTGKTIDYSMMLLYQDGSTMEFLVSIPGPKDQSEAQGTNNK